VFEPLQSSAFRLATIACAVTGQAVDHSVEEWIAGETSEQGSGQAFSIVVRGQRRVRKKARKSTHLVPHVSIYGILLPCSKTVPPSYLLPSTHAVVRHALCANRGEQLVMKKEKEWNMKLEEEKEAKILQIMPVPPGWEAVWGLVQEPEEGLPGFSTELIACWALVEVGERRFVTALLPDLESGELKLLVETEYFLGYRYPTEPTNWERRATVRRRAVKK
jgi:hypothetical protein